MVTRAPTSDTFCVVPGTRTVSGMVNGTVCPAKECKPEGEQTAGPFTVGQVATQSTPRLAGSPATVAPRLRTALAGAEGGRGLLMTIAVTVEVMMTVAEEALLRSVVDSAVTAMVFFVGTPGGAV